MTDILKRQQAVDGRQLPPDMVVDAPHWLEPVDAGGEALRGGGAAQP